MRIIIWCFVPLNSNREICSALCVTMHTTQNTQLILEETSLYYPTHLSTIKCVIFQKYSHKDIFKKTSIDYSQYTEKQREVIFVELCAHFHQNNAENLNSVAQFFNNNTNLKLKIRKQIHFIYMLIYKVCSCQQVVREHSLNKYMQGNQQQQQLYFLLFQSSVRLLKGMFRRNIVK